MHFTHIMYGDETLDPHINGADVSSETDKKGTKEEIWT